MDKRYRDKIAKEFRDCVLNTIRRLDNEETNRPFHAALLSDEALFWSRFERSFSTSFGQRVIEEISKIVALAGGASNADRQVVTEVELGPEYVSAINMHLDSLRENRGAKNWLETLREIREYAADVEVVANPKVKLIRGRVNSDLWWYKDGIDHYMSIKTVKPNIDQTVTAKNDLLRLTFHNPDCRVYFGLYYNPYGENRRSYAHNPPMRIFDFHRDNVVLIGRDYWDTLGGDGCYDEILNIAREVGAETREILANLR